MSTTVEDLRTKALELPWEDRLTLARDLLTSRDEEDVNEAEVDELWAAVIAGRLEAMDRADYVPVTREEVMSRIDEALAARRR